jgi:hypothetical protein
MIFLSSLFIGLVATFIAVSRTYPGSHRVPRCGIGAKYGASVSSR